MPTAILQTKLHIPIPTHERVVRPRLLERLDDGLQAGHRLILVSAPAGFGKTIVLADWIDQNEFKAAWISLDEHDNNPGSFLTYLIAGIQQIEPAFGEDVLSVLGSQEQPAIETIMTVLINQAASLSQRILIVLDDYHLITNSIIHQAITFFVENLPPQTHLALLSRADPSIPLARLRARGQMTELRAADLRFTTEEITPFLTQSMRLDISHEQVRSLEARTEGWIAGLQMAALSLKGKSDIDEFIEAFSGSHRFILDYLTEEVIQGQPDDIQQFILRTSILKRLSGPLCETVTDQERGQETLEKLEEVNLFLIPLDDERIWYRYHHLFADVMANRLQRVYPDLIPDLHLRAAKWLEKNEFITEAIEHALAADERTYAAELVEGRAMGLLREGGISTLNSWFNKLPKESIVNRPTLSMLYGWLLLLIGKQADVEYYLEIAENLSPSETKDNELRGNISAIRAYAASRIGDFDNAIEEANQALDLLPEDDLAIRAVVTFVLGWIYYSRWDLPRALETVHQAGQLGERGGNIHLAIQAWSAKAYMLKRQGELTESESIYKNALKIGTGASGKPLPFTAIIYSGLADLYLIQNEIEKARQFALVGLDLAEKWLNVDSQVGCLLTLAQIEAIEGDLNKAQTNLEEAKRLAATVQVTQGNQVLIAQVEAKIFGSSSGDVDQAALPDSLTERELEVLRLLAEGLSNRVISEKLIIALGTTKTHISRIMSKLNAENRTQAVAMARELGLIP
jgi:LuxR family maltose regulon positive regulatory protein